MIDSLSALPWHFWAAEIIFLIAYTAGIVSVLKHTSTRSIEQTERPFDPEYRVVRTGSLFYLQFRHHSDQPWTYAQGYHRGAPGAFNYQYDTSSNRSFHLDYTTTDIEQERLHPTLTPDCIRQAQRNTPQTPPQIDEIFEVLRASGPVYTFKS